MSEPAKHPQPQLEGVRCDVGSLVCTWVCTAPTPTPATRLSPSGGESQGSERGHVESSSHCCRAGLTLMLASLEERLSFPLNCCTYHLTVVL